MAIKPIQILINAKDNASAVFGSLQAKVGRAHIEADLIIRLGSGFLRLGERHVGRVDAGLRQAVVKDIPRRIDASRPAITIRMVMTERFLAADGLVDDSIDRRLIASLGRLDSCFSRLDGIARRRAVRAVVERVVRAVILRQVVLRVLELVADVEHRVRRQADDVVERRDSDVVVVLCRHEGLLRVGKLDL